MSELLKKIEDLRDEIRDEMDSLNDLRAVLDSIKVLVNYQKTGKPYPDGEYF